MYYRFYFLDEDNSILRAQDHYAEDDLAALEAAQVLSRYGPFEIWTNARLVARIAKGGNAGPQYLPLSPTGALQRASF